MPTDTDKKLNGAPQPFRRPVVWGRPPATVFRAGPLPRGGSLPPLPEPPRMQVGPGILSGSLIPRAAPTPGLVLNISDLETLAPGGTVETPELVLEAGAYSAEIVISVSLN